MSEREPTEFEKARAEFLARLDAIDQSVEGMRAQNSAEHSAQSATLRAIREAVNWLKAKWEHFTK